LTCQATAMTTNESTANNEFRLGKDGHKSLQDASSEQALIAAAQAGISDAMDELLVRHRRCVYRAARRFTQTHEEAEDLVQDAMLRAFVNVGKFRHESHFATWVIAIVNNAGLSMKRKGKGAYWLSLDSRKDESSSLSGWDVPDGRLNPEQEIVQQELLAILQKVLLRQSRMHQTILEQCVFNEARIGEVASSLGLTIGSAKSSLYRARRRVFDSFLKRGIVKRRNLPSLEVR
jgi:RNA polymerase sigma-70 factor (ECF subfamily)